MASITGPCLLLPLALAFASEGDELRIAKRVEEIIQIHISATATREISNEADDEMLALAQEHPQATAHLVRLLDNKDADTRWYAASYLGRTGAKPAVPALARMMQSSKENEINRRMACMALKWIGKESIPSLLEGLQVKNPEIRACVAWHLGSMVEFPEGKAVIAPLIETLGDGDADVRIEARSALIDFKQMAIAPLKQALTHKNDFVRVHAAAALLKIDPTHDKETLPVLKKSLRHTQSDIRRTAALASFLLGAKAKPVLAELIENLGDADKDVQCAAAIAIGKIGPEAKTAVPSLLKVLGDPSVKFHTIYALGKIHQEPATVVVALLGILQDPQEDYSNRELAAAALGNFGSDAKAAIPILEALSAEDADFGAALKKIKQQP